MTNRVTKEQALAALDDLDDFARMDSGVNATGATDLLKRFIEQKGADVTDSDFQKWYCMEDDSRSSHYDTALYAWQEAARRSLA